MSAVLSAPATSPVASTTTPPTTLAVGRVQASTTQPTRPAPDSQRGHRR